jgi:hypothetical protein
MSEIDWSKAGKRIRFQPPSGDGRNPDWNWAARRWKDEADYYTDELSRADVIGLVRCPTCAAPASEACNGLGILMVHTPRWRAAGERMLELHGPRFSNHGKGRQ